MGVVFDLALHDLDLLRFLTDPLCTPSGELAILPVLKDNPLKLELQAFARLIRGEPGPVPSGRYGLETLRLAFELLESGRSRQARVVSFAGLPVP